MNEKGSQYDYFRNFEVGYNKTCILMLFYDNDKCDLWSLGVIIYLLFFKSYPVQGQTESVLLNNIGLFEKRPLKTTNNKLLNDLLSKLLKSDPKKRITWEQYFNHPFFKSY